MSNKQILIICLGASVLFAAQTIYADPGNGAEKKSARALQIQIDKDTGRKINGSDSQAELSQQAALPTSSVQSSSSSNRSLSPTVHADGMISAQVGIEQMKYLVMTIDENGQRSISHVSAASIDSGAAPTVNNGGDK